MHCLNLQQNELKAGTLHMRPVVLPFARAAGATRTTASPRIDARSRQPRGMLRANLQPIRAKEPACNNPGMEPSAQTPLAAFGLSCMHARGPQFSQMPGRGCEAAAAHHGGVTFQCSVAYTISCTVALGGCCRGRHTRLTAGAHTLAAIHHGERQSFPASTPPTTNTQPRMCACVR